MMLVVALVLAVLFRTFLFQPFSIPSGAMKPTLLVGDYIFVSKYAYGYTHYSFPGSPHLFSGRVFAAQPQRGDVVVFRLPKNDATDYVKRIVGRPGDRIQMVAGVLHINGAPIKHERMVDFTDTSTGERVRQWRETLPNGVSYSTLDLQDNGFLDNTQVYTVPVGHYFMLGDNLDNSTDSRVLAAVGYVPFDNIIGRVERIYYSAQPGENGAPPTPLQDRIGLLVR